MYGSSLALTASNLFEWLVYLHATSPVKFNFSTGVGHELLIEPDRTSYQKFRFVPLIPFGRWRHGPQSQQPAGKAGGDILSTIKTYKTEGGTTCGKYISGRGSKLVFPKIVVPQNGWFIMENPIRMDDLGVPLFLETAKSCYAMVFLWKSGLLERRRSRRWSCALGFILTSSNFLFCILSH